MDREQATERPDFWRQLCQHFAAIGMTRSDVRAWRSFGRSGRAEWIDDTSLPDCDESNRQRSDERQKGGHGRICLWPYGTPQRPRIVVLSSRLGRAVEQRPDWFSYLRAAARRAADHGGCLLWASGMTASKYLGRLSELSNTPATCLHLPHRDESVVDWWKRLPLRASPDRANFSDAIVPGWLSPPIFLAAPLPLPAQLGDPSVLWAVKLADEILALMVRSGGHVETLLRRHLREPHEKSARVYLAISPQLTATRVAEPLLDAGAIRWHLGGTVASATSPRTCRSNVRCRRWCVAPPACLADAAQPHDWQMLTHCTRARYGPWPDQTESTYLDRLLRGEIDAERTAWATLYHILVTGHLIGSSRLIRGQMPMVSLTAVPLEQLSERRTFRAHRGHWDFEPYGLCFRRRRLQDLGARPVIYGDEAVWESLAAEDRPYFQPQTTTRRTVPIDWRSEEEWRVAGDLRLEDFGPNDAFAFVWSAEEATRLQPVCPYPVVALSPRDARRPVIAQRLP